MNREKRFLYQPQVVKISIPQLCLSCITLSLACVYHPLSVHVALAKKLGFKLSCVKMYRRNQTTFVKILNIMEHEQKTRKEERKRLKWFGHIHLSFTLL